MLINTVRNIQSCQPGLRATIYKIRNYKWSNKDRKTCLASLWVRELHVERVTGAQTSAGFSSLASHTVWPLVKFLAQNHLSLQWWSWRTCPASAGHLGPPSCPQLPTDITWLSQGISSLAQSCCSPGHPRPIKQHHLLPRTQVKSSGAALVPSWHLNHQEALGMLWWSSARTRFFHCYRPGFDLWSGN